MVRVCVRRDGWRLRTRYKGVVEGDDAWQLVGEKGAEQARVVEASTHAELRAHRLRQQRVALQAEPAEHHAPQLADGHEREPVVREVKLRERAEVDEWAE